SFTINKTVTYTCTGSGKDGIITLDLSNGSAPYTVTFNGSKQTGIQSSQVVYNNLAAGTYSYSATDNNGCTGSGSATVNRNTLPLAKVTTSKTICANGNTSISLGAS